MKTKISLVLLLLIVKAAPGSSLNSVVDRCWLLINCWFSSTGCWIDVCCSGKFSIDGSMDEFHGWRVEKYSGVTSKSIISWKKLFICSRLCCSSSTFLLLSFSLSLYFSLFFLLSIHRDEIYQTEIIIIIQITVEFKIFLLFLSLLSNIFVRWTFIFEKKLRFFE